MIGLVYVVIVGAAVLAIASGLWVAWGLIAELKGPRMGQDHKKRKREDFL